MFPDQRQAESIKPISPTHGEVMPLLEDCCIFQTNRLSIA